jgi:hypothetical protein
MEYIVEFENALPLNICDEIINFFENNKDKHFEGFISKNTIDKNYKICTEMYLNFEIEKNMNFNLEKFYIKYVHKSIQLNNIELLNENWRIKKYIKDEGFFNWHVDNMPVYKRRLLAIIYYLNDVDEGGETSFKIDNRIINIKPKKGKLIIFPANFCYVHKGNIPISNDKYILVTFLNIKDLN